MNRRDFLITAIGAPLAAKLLPEPVLAKAGDTLAAKVPGIVTQHYKGIGRLRSLANGRGMMFTGLARPTTVPPLTCCDIANLKTKMMADRVRREQEASEERFISYRLPENYYRRGDGAD